MDASGRLPASLLSVPARRLLAALFEVIVRLGQSRGSRILIRERRGSMRSRAAAGLCGLGLRRGLTRPLTQDLLVVSELGA
jgi:hypothetical protein